MLPTRHPDACLSLTVPERKWDGEEGGVKD